jgi:gliding motility-associated-like protein
VNAKNGSILAIVTGGTPIYLYNWSNASSSSTNSNLGSGNYLLTVTDKNSCTASTTALVGVSASISLVASTINPPCPQVNTGNVTLSVVGNGSPFTYLWSDGKTTANRFDLSEGAYSVTITDKFGCQIDSNFLLSYQYFVEVDATPETATINLGEQININTDVNQSNLLYIWKPKTTLSCSDCANPAAFPVYDAVYTIRVSDSLGCFAYDTVRIHVVPNHNLYVPNAFTPNADGINDVFEIFGNKSAIRYVNIEIFNRWGEKVFESNDINFKWDGTFRGELQNPSVFVYTLNISFVDGYRIENQKGSLTLIR